MTSSEDEIALSPNTIMEQRAQKVERILPPKSQHIYLNAYENFMGWRSEKKVKTLTESVFLKYFDELSKKIQPSTLWSVYSMLRATVLVKNNVNIKGYTKLISFLKRINVGHKSKKSKVLTSKQVETFLNTAPDDKYLATKVALIFGISGACRGIDLTNITINDVKTDSTLQAVNVPNTKNNHKRTFVVKGEYLNIVKKYQALRPENVLTTRFFLNYQKGKCTRQVIGRNKFSSMPKEIALFLKLDNPELYTGHCFRRTSATLLADSGANLTTIKRLGGWKSDQIAKEYMENSVQNKVKITDCITEDIHLIPNERQPGPSNCKNDGYFLPRPATDENPVTSGTSTSFNTAPLSQINTINLREAPLPGPSKITCAKTINPNVSKPDLRGSKLCRFCGQFNEECSPISPNFLADDKTTLAFNNISIQLEFSNDSPNTVCKDCDIKLQIMYDFVKVVETAQVSLKNGQIDIEDAVEEDTKFEMITLKPEYEGDSDEYDDSCDDNDNDDSDDNDTKEGILDSFTVDETIFIKETVQKRKSNNLSQEKPKKIKTEVDYKNMEFMIDIKQEVIDSYDINVDANTGISDKITEVLSEEHIKSETDKMISDENS